MLIDLQLHSTYSDGYLTPTELAKTLSQKGIKIASLTDHNTISGLGEFREVCQKYKIKTIPGLELYTKLNHKRFNILWYNFDKNDPELHKLLRSIQQRRRNRARTILKKLKKQGYKLDVNKIIDKYNHYIPVNKLIDDICADKNNQKKISNSLKIKNPRIEDIIHFLFYNKKKKNNITLRENHIDINRVIALRKKIGGQLILNHPGKYGHVKRPLVEKLKKLGIDGVEVLSPHHSLGAIMYFQSLTKELDLLETGGSDFHTHEGDNYLIQNSWQYFKVDSKNLRGIKKIIG